MALLAYSLPLMLISALGVRLGTIIFWTVVGLAFVIGHAGIITNGI